MGVAVSSVAENLWLHKVCEISRTQCSSHYRTSRCFLKQLYLTQPAVTTFETVAPNGSSCSGCCGSPRYDVAAATTAQLPKGDQRNDVSMSCSTSTQHSPVCTKEPPGPRLTALHVNHVNVNKCYDCVLTTLSK